MIRLFCDKCDAVVERLYLITIELAHPTAVKRALCHACAVLMEAELLKPPPTPPSETPQPKPQLTVVCWGCKQTVPQEWDANGDRWKVSVHHNGDRECLMSEASVVPGGGQIQHRFPAKASETPQKHCTNCGVAIIDGDLHSRIEAGRCFIREGAERPIDAAAVRDVRVDNAEGKSNDGVLTGTPKEGA